MKRKVAGALVSRAGIALICLPASATDTRRWPAYGNVRFGLAACDPPDFRGQGEAGNSDGQRFKSGDGAVLAVYGNNIEPGGKLDEFLAEDITKIAGKGAAVTYRAGKANWLVASGHGPKGEFYLKRVRRRDQMLNFELTYPARLHAHYASLIKAFVGCFTIGQEPGY